MPDKPNPPVPAEVDLKDFAFTPLYRARLFGSSFHARANDAEWRAGLTLWLKSQDQVPAGSLPTDDIDLCRLAELGRDLKTWRKVKVIALHGWYECADGKLYHDVVAEIVKQQWQGKCAQRDRTEAARAARAAKRLLHTLSQDENSSVTDTVTGSKREGQGQGQGQGEGQLRETEGLPNRIPSEPEKTESDAPREGKDFVNGNPVVQPCGLPPQAPKPPKVRENIKKQLLQKLMRYCTATMRDSERAKAIMGLMGEDPDRDAQWWFDDIDRRRKRDGWDDTREWKTQHLGVTH